MWDTGITMYNDLLHKNCICSVEYDKLIEFYRNLFEDGSPIDIKLLGISMLRLAAEKYITTANRYGIVCVNLTRVVEWIQNDFSKMVKCLSEWEDKFLKRSVALMISTSAYLFQPGDFQSWVERLIEVALKDLFNNNVHFIEVLCMMLLYAEQEQACHAYKFTGDLLQSCNQTRNVEKVKLKELRHCCLLVLSFHWKDFTNQIAQETKIELKDGTVVEVLKLWQCSNEALMKCEEPALVSAFLCPSHICTLIARCSRLCPLSFRIFLETTIQVFTFNKGCLSLFATRDDLKHHVLHSLTTEFLPHLYKIYLLSERQKENRKLTANYPLVLVQRSVCIVLKILCSVPYSASVLTIFSDLENFIKGNIVRASDVCAFLWIPCVLLEQDDLLFESMLSALNLYLLLRDHLKTCTDDKTLRLKENLNPHKMFLQVMLKLGFDHNILLDLLMSNETCILLYLMQFLKLILSEWEQFVQCHASSQESKLFVEPRKSCLYFCSSVTNEGNEDKKTIDCQSTSALPKNKLVSYSSTSSSSDYEDDACDSQDDAKLNVHKSQLIFQKLRHAIENLTEINEFPYDAKPLIGLLKKAENCDS